MTHVTGLYKLQVMLKILLISGLSLFTCGLFGQEIDYLILNNQYDLALQAIDSELIKNDAQPILYLKKGVVLQKRFDYPGAIKALEKGYRLDSLNTIVNSLSMQWNEKEKSGNICCCMGKNLIIDCQ